MIEIENFKCDLCNRTFKDVEALKDHNLAKHPVLETPQAKSNSFKWLILIIVIFLIIVGIYFLLNKNSDVNENFINCLADKGAKMYGAYWCNACNKQKSILKNNQNIPYIECSLPNRAGETEICIQKNISLYPTWEFKDGVRKEGVLTLEQLSQLTNCPINKN